MTASMSMPASRAPGRVLLRTAGILTQLSGAACLLLGTITFVLIQQNKSAGTGAAIAWAIGALAAIVFGGLMARGGLVSLLVCTVLDLAFGVVLLIVDRDAVGGVFRVLPPADIAVLADGLFGAGIGFVGVALLCLASIPQALRYGRWLHEASGMYPQVSQYGDEITEHVRHDHILPGSTARGWHAPGPTGSMWIMPAAPPEERRSRRRMYIALAGFAIGFGAGIGVLVSSIGEDTTTGPKQKLASRGSATEPDVGSAGSGSVGSASSAEPTPPKLAVDTLLASQKEMLENGDVKGLAALLAPNAFGFGIDSDEVGEGRDVLEAQLGRDLGDFATGATVVARSTNVGEEAHHAWIAQELELSAPGKQSKRFAVTQLASAIDGKWVIAAWCWGVLVPDSLAEEKKILGTLPAPKPVANLVTGPEQIGVAARTAFASRAAFADARSERADGFNFGSGPGERSVGGRGIKRVFQKLRAQIRVHDGIRAVTSDAWDPANKDALVAYAALNVDFTAKSRAQTDLTQTFRVLAVFVKEGPDWKIVQTQWSHGGPVR